jgi:hypothetical protein
LAGAPRETHDLIQVNLGSSGLVTLAVTAEGGSRYTIRRGYKQSASLLTGDGRSITSVDLDRGTFLPLDAYSSHEIEAIANEALGDKRRNLLDDLVGEQLRTINLHLAEHRRALQANADKIHAERRSLADITEQIEELRDIPARLAALGPLPANDPTAEFTKATKQQQCNGRELRRLEKFEAALQAMRSDIKALRDEISTLAMLDVVEPSSLNEPLLFKFSEQLKRAVSDLEKPAKMLEQGLLQPEEILSKARQLLQQQHGEQAARLMSLQKMNEAAGELVRERASLEQKVSHLEELEKDRVQVQNQIQRLFEERKALKAEFIGERDLVSALRDSVAERLQRDAGTSVRIRVLRNADDLAYRTLLVEGLKGARVRNHDEILTTLLRLRPEQLAQFIQTSDLTGFEAATDFGQERSKRILEAFKENLDPLVLEIVEIEDQVRIELNVATEAQPLFKDASDLSRGQKCTALLPILLARRDSPLIIDQPEDNLDNHFIYETVVNTIKRLRKQRQMIFITHNANIPVLAEADLIVVMNSDGKVGFLEKSGTVDECRDEVINLLEGGREAFELRGKRYGRR